MCLLIERLAASPRSSRNGTTSTGSSPRHRLLHNTHRRTHRVEDRPPSDFTPRGTTLRSRAGIWLRRLGGTARALPRHPDPAQERLFFRLLGECLDNGSVSASMLDSEIARGHIRTDAHDCVAQAHRAAA